MCVCDCQSISVIIRFPDLAWSDNSTFTGTRHQTFWQIPFVTFRWPCIVINSYNKSSLLAYSMVQSPWEANWFAAGQEIPRISRNPKVHYRTHKRPPPVSILVQSNPVHITTSHLLEIHPNIHPSTPRSPQWFLPLRFPHQEATRCTNFSNLFLE